MAPLPFRSDAKHMARDVHNTLVRIICEVNLGRNGARRDEDRGDNSPRPHALMPPLLTHAVRFSRLSLSFLPRPGGRQEQGQRRGLSQGALLPAPLPAGRLVLINSNSNNSPNKPRPAHARPYGVSAAPVFPTPCRRRLPQPAEGRAPLACLFSQTLFVFSPGLSRRPPAMPHSLLLNDLFFLAGLRRGHPAARG